MSEVGAKGSIERPPLMVVDVESIGLGGQGFAVGLVIVERGEVTNSWLGWCDPALAQGSMEGRGWVIQNVMPSLGRATGVPTHASPTSLRDEFWELWVALARPHPEATDAAVMMADCPWPVEARFLLDCVADHPERREWQGPYPLLDAQTLRAAGLACATEDVHQPLIDAENTWASVRDWWLGRAS